MDVEKICNLLDGYDNLDIDDDDLDYSELWKDVTTQPDHYGEGE